MALKSGFDAHWFCVAQPHRDSIVDVECYVPDDDRFPPCYDELVVKEQNQFLPMAVIHIGGRGFRKDGIHQGAALDSKPAPGLLDKLKTAVF